MRKIYMFLFCVTIGVALCGAPAFSQETAEKGETKPGASLGPESPIALVNNVPILKKTFDRAMEVYVQNLIRNTGGKHSTEIAPNDTMKSEVLKEIIDQEVLYQASKDTIIEGMQAKIDEEYQNYKARFPSEEVFKQLMAEQNVDDKEFREMIERRIRMKGYVDANIVPTVNVEDASVKAFYDGNSQYFQVPEEVKASHILIMAEQGVDKDKKATAKEKAKLLLDRINQGEDFAELAKQNSEDPGSGAQGGDLGYFGRGRMVKPFEEAAFSLKVGEVSGLVLSQFGYHIIKVTDKKEPSVVSLEEASPRIKEFLLSQKVNGAIVEKIQSLRSVAKVEVITPHL